MFKPKRDVFSTQRKTCYNKLYEHQARVNRLQRELDALKARMISLAKKGQPFNFEAGRAASLKNNIAEAQAACLKTEELLEALRKAETAAEFGDLARSGASAVKKASPLMPKEDDLQGDLDAVSDMALDAARIGAVFAEPGTQALDANAARDDIVAEIERQVAMEREGDVLSALSKTQGVGAHFSGEHIDGSPATSNSKRGLRDVKL